MQPHYQDDWVTLYHGDCLEVTEWLAADVLVTDPPYGMTYQSNSSKYGQTSLLANDHDTRARDHALQLWQDRPALIFGTWRVLKPDTTRAVIIWDKGYTGLGALDLPWGLSHEDIYVLGSKWPKRPNGGRIREGGTPNRESSVLRAIGLNSQATDRPDHPTPKPVGLMESLIAKCPPGIIADPFTGSGSTLVAAKLQGRRAIGVEIEERYCEVAAKRLAQDAFDFEAVG